METLLAKLCVFRAKCSTEPFLFLYMFATAVHYPLIPVLLILKACHQVYNRTVCSNLQMIAFRHEEKVVYVQATEWNTLYAVVHFVPALLFILPFGSLSDLVSKKKLLMIPALALLLQSVVFACCAFYQSLPIALLLTGGSLPGFHGSVQGTIALSNSYMADRIPAGPARTMRMAILSVQSVLGLAFGTYFAGAVSHQMGIGMPFIISSVICLVNLLYVVVILPENKATGALPESGTDMHQLIEEEKVGSPTRPLLVLECIQYSKQALINIVTFVRKYRGHENGKYVCQLLVAYACVTSASAGEAQTNVLFITHSPLHFSKNQVGTYLLTMYLIRGFGALIISLMTKRLNIREDYSAALGLVSGVSMYVVMALTKTEAQLYGITVLSVGSVFAIPCIRSLLTKLVGQDKNGTVLSFAGFLGLAADSVIAVSANLLFQNTAHFFPGLVMLLFAFVCLIGVGMMLIFCCSCIGKEANLKEENKEENCLQKERDGKEENEGNEFKEEYGSCNP